MLHIISRAPRFVTRRLLCCYAIRALIQLRSPNLLGDDPRHGLDPKLQMERPVSSQSRVRARLVATCADGLTIRQQRICSGMMRNLVFRDR
jgi:hypothetical protein